MFSLLVYFSLSGFLTLLINSSLQNHSPMPHRQILQFFFELLSSFFFTYRVPNNNTPVSFQIYLLYSNHTAAQFTPEQLTVERAG
ncbi:predicted protein [Methanosarcina acetivorans C2A]|uniref:Uncharacterized protein n=1 Tax=Methanosarcina acetivorans (strain ATCC 35395 / DSM 2834 / JCM 12185 / C2A) TaxID=188937 RepID=Q8TQ71_METAC|nr:predicted protein [Methanosarcina acetivorans C2A]